MKGHGKAIGLPCARRWFAVTGSTGLRGILALSIALCAGVALKAGSAEVPAEQQQVLLALGANLTAARDFLSVYR